MEISRLQTNLEVITTENNNSNFMMKEMKSIADTLRKENNALSNRLSEAKADLVKLEKDMEVEKEIAV